MNHPVLVGLGTGIAVALAALAVGQHVFRTPARPSMETVRIDQVWAASLYDLSGRAQPLKQWQGQILVVNFWAPWCPQCRAEIPGFQRLQARYGDQGLQFVGIALDEADTVGPYVREARMTYPILLAGPDGTTLVRAAGNQYGGMPYTLILDRQGYPVATLTGVVSEERLEDLFKTLL